MPNWCENHLILKHADPAMIERAKKAFQEGTFLNEFVPIPAPLKETIAGSLAEGYDRDLHEATQKINQKHFGYANWYDFCVAEWGTKWDVGGQDEHFDSLNETTLSLSFSSAWSPPTNAYYKMQELGFDVVAYYYEPGVGFAGKHDENGDACFELDDESMPDDVIDMFNIDFEEESEEE